MSPLRQLAEGSVREPLRIVLTGSSTSLFVSPPRRRRDEGTYGELLPHLLADAGVRAQTVHTGKWFDMVSELRSRYETAVRNHFPDVLVLDYGFVESQPHGLPTWAARHFATWDQGSRAASVAYRRHVAPRIGRRLRTWQQVSARTLGTRTWRLSPQRFTREMLRVIELAREDTGCLVLVLDCDPPGEKVLHWLPGMHQRWAHYQRVIAGVVAAAADPQVRLVTKSASITDELGVAAGLPDGIHRSPLAHRRVAEQLTAQILGWLDEPVPQPLDRPPMGARPAPDERVVPLARSVR